MLQVLLLSLFLKRYNIRLDFFISILYNTLARRCDGMADVTDSKSVGSDTVRVQVPPPAPEKSTYQMISALFS